MDYGGRPQLMDQNYFKNVSFFTLDNLKLEGNTDSIVK